MALDTWSDDAFLDPLRQQGDDLADDAVARLHAEHGAEVVSRIFQTLRGDHQPLPADSPQAFRDFMAATDEPPAGLDLEKLNRGAAAFRRHAFPAAVVLLAASLPSGYSAPALSRILTVSDNLGAHPYKRLMGVLQIGAIAHWLHGRMPAVWAAITVGIIGGVNIPLYEHLARDADWWFYRLTPMLGGAPYYIIVGEFLLALPLVWMAAKLGKMGPFKGGIVLGVVEGLVILVAYVIAWWLIGPCQGAVIQLSCG